jgi:hypothetical protein
VKRYIIIHIVLKQKNTESQIGIDGTCTANIKECAKSQTQRKMILGMFDKRFDSSLMSQQITQPIDNVQWFVQYAVLLLDSFKILDLCILYVHSKILH